MDSIRLFYVEGDSTNRELTLRYLRQHAPDLELRVVGIARAVASTLNLDEMLQRRVDFAAYAAVGIENARMYEGLEQAALRIEARSRSAAESFMPRMRGCRR